MNDALTAQTVELLQQMIRNQCVNDGTIESGQEVRTTDLLRTYLEGSGLDLEVYEPDGAPGRASLVARIEGSDPSRAHALPHGPHRRGARDARARGRAIPSAAS